MNYEVLIWTPITLSTPPDPRVFVSGQAVPSTHLTEKETLYLSPSTRQRGYFYGVQILAHSAGKLQFLVMFERIT